MNILISTTTNWNVGDDFIRLGVQNLLDEIYPNANYIHYDRNPNNMISFPDNQLLEKKKVGNVMCGSIDWNIIDLVVLAGSPEFLHEPLLPIYEGLLTRPEIPLWAIGVGYTYPTLLKRLCAAEKNVLARDSTKIICRQKDLQETLSSYLNKQVNLLPCPAIFCSKIVSHSFEREKLYILDTFETDTSDGHIAVASLDTLKTNRKAYFDTDYNRYLNNIWKYKTVISQRLHGAIAALSNGSYVDCIGDSFRVQAAIEQFYPILKCNDPDKINQFKTHYKKEYLKILTT